MAAWEIASIVVTTLIGEWVIFSIGGESKILIAFPVICAFAYLFFSHRAWGEGRRELGWRWDNFGQALKLLLGPMCLLSVLLIAIGLRQESLDFGKWRGGQSVLGVPALGVLWGLMQQYVLQSFINRRAQVIWGAGGRSIVLVGLLFGALHLPNPALTIITLVGGIIWAWVYQRAPNLFALALSHSVMTWVVVSTVPSAWLHGLRVGYKYFG